MHSPIAGQEVGDEGVCPLGQPAQQHDGGENVLGVLDGCIQPLFIPAVWLTNENTGRDTSHNAEEKFVHVNSLPVLQIFGHLDLQGVLEL